MRVRLPLQSNKGKCSACSNSFNIRIDEHGNVLVAKTFFVKISYGFAGGVLFGFIGLFIIWIASLYGSSDEKLGFLIIGLLISVGFMFGFANDDINQSESNKKNTEKKQTKPTSGNSDKSNTQKNNESKIIRCPSCKKKIRVRLPLLGNKGKCSACSCSFNIRIDEHGNVRIDKATTENKSRKNQKHATVSDYFKVLEIESTATPGEVKAAYRRKIREYHPDRVASLGEKLKQVANEESKTINAAYSALKSKGLAS